MAPKPKPAPSQPTPPPALEDLFTTLNRHIQASAFDNVVKLTDQSSSISLLFSNTPPFIHIINVPLFYHRYLICIAVLAIAPDDEDALRCKVVALIKNDHVEDALSAIKSSRKQLDDFHFFKARQFPLSFCFVIG